MKTYDQFEVEHASTYSGSYMSKTLNVHGTIFNTSSYARRQIAESSIGSINADAFNDVTILVSEFYSYSSSIDGINNPSLVPSFERFNCIFSDEVIEDTLVANPIEFYVKNVDAIAMKPSG